MNSMGTCKIVFDIAIASTGTTEPIKRPVKRGVIRTDVIVLELVKLLLNATSLLLKKLA